MSSTDVRAVSGSRLLRLVERYTALATQVEEIGGMACLVAIAFSEPSATPVSDALSTFDQLVTSNLLEAEVRSAFAREAATLDPAPLLSGLTWFYPKRRLTAEFQRVTQFDHVRGADLWHLACALALSPDGAPLSFMTLDRRQKRVAEKLGFLT